MTVKIGTLDHALRAIAGLSLAARALVGWPAPRGWLGLAPLATALVGYCTPYALLGVSTCRAHSKIGGHSG
jgi:hypothetical protein